MGHEHLLRRNATVRFTEPGGTLDRKQRAAAAFDAVAADLRALSRWLYENPELGHQEHESSARLAVLLERLGFAVEYPAYGLETAFAARTGTAGPEVIICAEYDALPEIGHACGHNVIAAAALGAGAALREMVDELGCRVTVLGTPAEEALGGKVDLIEAGAFAGGVAAMMIHPGVKDVVDPLMLAVSHFDVEFHGRESHASMSPQTGINALDAAVQAYVNISTLRQSLYPTDKVHGIITHGGGAPNVIPDHTAMAWYVRAATGARLGELRERVGACFDAAATATGCTWKEHDHGHAYEDLLSDPVLAAAFAANAAALGRPMGRGADEPPGATGSSDIGNVSHVLPTIHPMLDMDAGEASNHQRAFAAATIAPGGERVIRDGALAMAGTIIDVASEHRWEELGG